MYTLYGHCLRHRRRWKARSDDCHSGDDFRGAEVLAGLTSPSVSAAPPSDRRSSNATTKALLPNFTA